MWFIMAKKIGKGFENAKRKLLAFIYENNGK